MKLLIRIVALFAVLLGPQVVQAGEGTPKRLPNILLGVSLDTGRLEAVSLRRSNGSLQVRQTMAVPLTLNPAT